jgi:hypothetical protein
MTASSRLLVLAFALSAASAGARAQECFIPPESNEAKMLAFFEAPLAFSLAAAPTALPPGAIRVDAEIVPVPTPSAAITRSGFCFTSKRENPRLAPVFGRPRVAIGLPLGFVVEGSYLPPITVGDAQPNLASFALSEVRALPVATRLGSVTLLLRAHGTVGSVRGPITCPSRELQMNSLFDPCYGTHPSRDTFHPYMYGGEGALGLTTRSGRWSLYAGGGITWLDPRFQVGFTDATGYTDRTRLIIDGGPLERGTVFGGITARLVRAFEVSAQVYSVPADVTTVRFGAGYRIR